MGYRAHIMFYYISKSCSFPRRSFPFSPPLLISSSICYTFPPWLPTLIWNADWNLFFAPFFLSKIFKIDAPVGCWFDYLVWRNSRWRVPADFVSTISDRLMGEKERKFCFKLMKIEVIEGNEIGRECSVYDRLGVPTLATRIHFHINLWICWCNT